MPKISQSKLESMPVPVPSLTEQHRILAELDALQAEVDALKRLQAETAAELAALLPSILDRAFLALARLALSERLTHCGQIEAAYAVGVPRTSLRQ